MVEMLLGYSCHCLKRTAHQQSVAVKQSSEDAPEMAAITPKSMFLRTAVHFHKFEFSLDLTT